MKTCSSCEKRLPDKEFYADSKTADGLRYCCKSCWKEKRRSNYLKKRGEHQIKNRQWIEKNSEDFREYRNEYRRERWKTDPEYRLQVNLRRRLNKAIRRGQKTGSAVRDLGCTIPELMSHLESQFSEGMNWDNYGSYWEVDHIIPLAALDLTDREQFLQATHYANLQPLTGEENRLKSDRCPNKKERS